MAQVSADDAKTRLLEKAGEIFAEQGFARTTVRQICAAASVNLAAVNYYFGDKMGLYVETVKYAHTARMVQVGEISSEMPPAQKLGMLVLGMMSSLLDRSRPAWDMKLIMREMIEPTEACRSLTEQKIRPMFEQMTAVVGELLPPGTERMVIVRHAFSVVGQCLFYRTQEHVARHLIGSDAFDQFSAPVIAQHIVNLTLRGMGHPAIELPTGVPT